MSKASRTFSIEAQVLADLDTYVEKSKQNEFVETAIVQKIKEARKK